LGILEEKQYVTSHIEQQSERPDKKVYTITAAGKDAFDNWVKDFPQKTSKITRDEFLVRIFFGSKLSKAELINQFEQYVERKMNERETIIKEINRKINRYSIEFVSNTEKLYWGFIEKRAQMTNDMAIKWAKECIKELKSSDLP
jgi:DNA-binding PadR family transcriptional regulator